MAGRLTDVARKVNVSEATVSRVLNGKPGVSESTRQAVLTALDVLGYERPTKLRGNRGRLAGLVLPELINPIFPSFAEVIGGALAQQGFIPVLCTRAAGGVSESEYIDLLLRQHVSGVVFAGGFYSERNAEHAHYELIEERGLPAVLINASIEGLDFPRVSCDDAVATEQAISHLLALGHRDIGLLLGPEGHIPSERKLAAAQALSESLKFPLPAHHVVYSEYGLESGQAAAGRLIADGVTAIVCASDPLALGVCRAARRLGLQVPRDLSVVGYDDSALMSSTEPALTTVRQPIEPMGRMAVELLAREIGGARVSREELLYEPELVVRRSTGPLPQSP